MSAITSPISYAPPEAFGQTGVRQYFKSSFVILSAMLFAVSATMWVRSYRTIDLLDLVHESTRVGLRSSSGRLVFFCGFTNPNESAGGWGYSTRPAQRIRDDPWRDSFWKTIGIGMGLQTGDRSGWWFRLKWSTATVLTAIIPAWHVYKQARSKRAGRNGLAGKVDVFCARCGRALSSKNARCACCGRSEHSTLLVAGGPKR